MRERASRAWIVVAAALAVAACSGDDDGDGSGGSGGSGAGTTSSGSGGSGTGTTSSGSGGSGTGTTSSSSGQGGAGASDPYAAARIACIDKINELRATKGRPAYARWTSAEFCSDDEVTSDEGSNNPHGAFGQCSESGQNECLGGGPSGIVGCLQMMWDEKDQAGCAGCDACADAYNPNCPNCDFFGSDTGDVCGHYVNMSANYFSEAACGFSSLGGWSVINFH